VCSDSGFVVTKRGAGRCECAKARIRKARFATAVEITPKLFRERYGIVNGLESFRTMESFKNDHPRQAEALALVSKYPERSFYIFGRTGAHKTTLAWAILQEAGRRGTLVGGNTGKSLIDTIRSYAFDGKRPPKGVTFYSLEQIETNNDRICILIDDIDGITPLTEYTFSTLWELLDKVMAYEQQLIVTSNRSIDALFENWAERDRDGKANSANFSEKLIRRFKEIFVDIDLS
jgi:DNA replication protein DnaC